MYYITFQYMVMVENIVKKKHARCDQRRVPPLAVKLVVSIY